MLPKMGYDNSLLVHLRCDLDHGTDISDLYNLQNMLSLTNMKSWESKELVLSALVMGDAELSTQKWRSNAGQWKRMTNVSNKGEY